MGIIQEYNSFDIYARYDIDAHPDEKDFCMHIHDRYEIYYFVSGNVKYLVEGYEYSLEPGTIMIMRPGESHAAKIIKDETYERYSVNFYASFLDAIDPEHKWIKPFTDRPLGCGNKYREAEFDDLQLQKVFSKIKNPDTNAYSQHLKVNIYLLLLFEQISQAYEKRGFTEYKSPKNLSEQVVAYVNRHLLEELSVPVLAGKFFLSTSQFSRIFKQATGSPVWEYIIAKRLTMAKEKIRSGISAREASAVCGFGDYSVFYRAYVKHFGCAPTNMD